MKIGKIDAFQHPRPQCTLYVPTYKFNPNYEKLYYAPDARIRKVHYTDLQYNTFESSKGSFQKEITSSCTRPKRLIMIPFLHEEDNFGLDPVSSPFATEPATTSPCVITQFNCSVNNVNLFPNDITYSYDHYLQHLNGQQGVSGILVAII